MKKEIKIEFRKPKSSNTTLKQKAQKDYNSGDLFSWGGIAANDEEFSVPGFFTKKSK